METELLKDKVLVIVDDEVDLREILASELEFMGARVFQAQNIESAKNFVLENKIDVVVSDIRMPGGTGIDLLNSLKLIDANKPPVVLITGFADITAEDAFHKGAEALVNKPFGLDDLINVVVRYTHAFAERFKMPSGWQNFTSLKGITAVDFGRGGVAMEIKGNNIDVGEMLNFDFEYKSERFQGVGVCRWLKVLDYSSKKSVIGMEFIGLTEDSLVNFKRIHESRALMAYIPSSKS